MFAIEVTTTFYADHALHLPGGGLEPSHGHAFEVTARITARLLDAQHTVLDFHAVKDCLDAILLPWKNRNLNDIEPFKTKISPSAERIIEQVGLQLRAAIRQWDPQGNRGVELVEVRMTEAPHCVAIWSPN